MRVRPGIVCHGGQRVDCGNQDAFYVSPTMFFAVDLRAVESMLERLRFHSLCARHQLPFVFILRRLPRRSAVAASGRSTGLRTLEPLESGGAPLAGSIHSRAAAEIASGMHPSRAVKTLCCIPMYVSRVQSPDKEALSNTPFLLDHHPLFRVITGRTVSSGRTHHESRPCSRIGCNKRGYYVKKITKSAT